MCVCMSVVHCSNVFSCVYGAIFKANPQSAAGDRHLMEVNDCLLADRMCLLLTCAAFLVALNF